MKVVITGSDLAQALKVFSADDIGFVPTMGGLHDGHATLLREARRRHAVVVASVFVNPLQFGPLEDFVAYPRTQALDEALLAQTGVDIAFFPDEGAIYPHGKNNHTQVLVPGLSDILCGAVRPGHFCGVTTVVARLLGLVRPRSVYFGKKDYQQWRIIEKMVTDLALPMTVIGVETVREFDGLARSTRNQYLNSHERDQAAWLYRTLKDVVEKLMYSLAFTEIEQEAMCLLREHGFVPEYVAIRRANDLGVPDSSDTDFVVLAAARLGQTRLIDNLEYHRHT